jgi:hypothetical protein
MLDYGNNKNYLKSDYIGNFDKSQGVIMAKSLCCSNEKENHIVPIAPKKRRFVMTKAKRRKIFGSIRKENKEHIENERKIETKEKSGKTQCVDRLPWSQIEFTREKRLQVNTKVEFTTKSNRIHPPTPTTAISELTMTSPQTAMMKHILAEAKAKSTQLAANVHDSHSAPEKDGMPMSLKSPQLYPIDKCINSKYGPSEEDGAGSVPQNFAASSGYSTFERTDTSSKPDQCTSENPSRSNIRKKIAYVGISAANAAKKLVIIMEDKVTECFLPTPTTPINGTKKGTNRSSQFCC